MGGPLQEGGVERRVERGDNKAAWEGMTMSHLKSGSSGLGMGRKGKILIPPPPPACHQWLCPKARPASNARYRLESILYSIIFNIFIKIAAGMQSTFLKNTLFPSTHPQVKIPFKDEDYYNIN